MMHLFYNITDWKRDCSGHNNCPVKQAQGPYPLVIEP